MDNAANVIFLGQSMLVTIVDESGGSTTFDATNVPEITIKLAQQYSDEKIKKVLMHELFEAGLHILGCTFRPENPNNYLQLGILNHGQLTILCDAVCEAFEYINHQLFILPKESV